MLCFKLSANGPEARPRDDTCYQLVTAMLPSTCIPAADVSTRSIAPPPVVRKAKRAKVDNALLKDALGEDWDFDRFEEERGFRFLVTGQGEKAMRACHDGAVKHFNCSVFAGIDNKNAFIMYVVINRATQLRPSVSALRGAMVTAGADRNDMIIDIMDNIEHKQLFLGFRQIEECASKIGRVPQTYQKAYNEWKKEQHHKNLVERSTGREVTPASVSDMHTEILRLRHANRALLREKEAFVHEKEALKAAAADFGQQLQRINERVDAMVRGVQMLPIMYRNTIRDEVCNLPHGHCWWTVNVDPPQLSHSQPSHSQPSRSQPSSVTDVRLDDTPVLVEDGFGLSFWGN